MLQQQRPRDHMCQERVSGQCDSHYEPDRHCGDFSDVWYSSDPSYSRFFKSVETYFSLLHPQSCLLIFHQLTVGHCGMLMLLFLVQLWLHAWAHLFAGNWFLADCIRLFVQEFSVFNCVRSPSTLISLTRQHVWDAQCLFYA